MTKKDLPIQLKQIGELIFNGSTDHAIEELNKFIQDNDSCDEAWYLRGNAYRKKGDFRQALNNYLKAMELNPESPAREAHDMLIRILDFYNKDMFNH